MNKAELLKEISASADLTQKQAEATLSAFVDAVTATLVKNDKLTLVGFGTFEVAERAARTGRNPATGEALQIPATTLPKFKAGKTLREAVAKPKPFLKPAAKALKKATTEKSEPKAKKVAKK